MLPLAAHASWRFRQLPLVLGLALLPGCAVYTTDASYVLPRTAVVPTGRVAGVVAPRPIVAPGTILTQPGPVWVSPGPIHYVYGRPPLYTRVGRYPARWYRPIPRPLPAYRPLY